MVHSDARWLCCTICLAYLAAAATSNSIPADENAASNSTIQDVLKATPSLSLLTQQLSTDPSLAALWAVLGDNTTFLTLFAPNDDALANNQTLTPSIVELHVAAGNFTRTELSSVDRQFVHSQLKNGSLVHLGGEGQVLQIHANLESTPTKIKIEFGIPGDGPSTVATLLSQTLASNGVVHLIDKVVEIPESLSEMAARTGKLTNFTAALHTSGWAPAVDTAPSMTVLAPTDAAMASDALLELMRATDLHTLLGLHLVDGVWYSTMLKNSTQLTSKITAVLGVDVGSEEGSKEEDYIKVYNVNNPSGVRSEFTIRDIVTANGVLHVLDTVLPVPFNSSKPFIDNIVTVPMVSRAAATIRDNPTVQSALSGSNDLVLYLPTNTAWLLTTQGKPGNYTDTLLYHITGAEDVECTDINRQPVFKLSGLGANLPDGNQRIQIRQNGGQELIVFGEPGSIGGQAVVDRSGAAIQEASNGFMYTVNRVLLPPPAPADLYVNSQHLPIVTFLTKIAQAGLSQQLMAPGLTILAPSDDAWQRYSARLEAMSTEEIKTLLLAHLVPSNACPEYLQTNGSKVLHNGAGQAIFYHVIFDAMFFSSSVNKQGFPISSSNVLTSGGVLHVFDGILFVKQPVIPAAPRGHKGLTGGEIAAVVLCVLLVSGGCFLFLYRNKDRFPFLGGVSEQGTSLNTFGDSSEPIRETGGYGAL